MSNHLDKDEYYVLEAINRIRNSRPIATRRKLLEFLGNTYALSILHEILDDLRRKEMIISAEKAGFKGVWGYQITPRGKTILEGIRIKEARHKDTFGICDRCGIKTTLTFYARQHLCKDCLLVDNNPLNLEDFVYSRGSAEHTYPSSFSSTYGIRVTERKRGKKRKSA